jgi:hypothetical protein
MTSSPTGDLKRPGTTPAVLASFCACASSLAATSASGLSWPRNAACGLAYITLRDRLPSRPEFAGHVLVPDIDSVVEPYPEHRGLSRHWGSAGSRPDDHPGVSQGHYPEDSNHHTGGHQRYRSGDVAPDLLRTPSELG